MKKIKVSKLSTGSIYKLFAIGLSAGFLPLFLLLGLFGAFGMETITWNNQPVTGLNAILISPLMVILMTVIFTVLIGSICALGLWLYSFIRPLIIKYE